MHYFDYSTPSDARAMSGLDPAEEESTTEYSIDDVYKMLDSIDQRLSDLQISNTKSSRSSEVASTGSDMGTSTDAMLASITDASGKISDNTEKSSVWIMVLAFIIVIFELKRMIRGSVKQWVSKGD